MCALNVYTLISPSNCHRGRFREGRLRSGGDLGVHGNRRFSLIDGAGVGLRGFGFVESQNDRLAQSLALSVCVWVNPLDRPLDAASDAAIMARSAAQSVPFERTVEAPEDAETVYAAINSPKCHPKIRYDVEDVAACMVLVDDLVMQKENGRKQKDENLRRGQTQNRQQSDFGRDMIEFHEVPI